MKLMLLVSIVFVIGCGENKAKDKPTNSGVSSTGLPDLQSECTTALCQGATSPNLVTFLVIKGTCETAAAAAASDEDIVALRKAQDTCAGGVCLATTDDTSYMWETINGVPIDSIPLASYSLAVVFDHNSSGLPPDVGDSRCCEYHEVSVGITSFSIDTCEDVN